MYLSIYLSYLFVCLSVCLSVNLKNAAILRDILNFWTCQTSKTKQFCETSSIFELDNVKNETSLRDFLNFRSWQHQKRNNSARLPSKMESWVQSWRPRTNAFCDFSSKVMRLPRKSDARSYELLHLSRKTISAKLKIWCSKMQPLSGNRRPDLLRS